MKYLESLRKTGFWFDGTRHVVRSDKKSIHDIAPLFVLEHKERYREYLVHPDNLTRHTNFKQPATYNGDYGILNTTTTKGNNSNITIAVTLGGRTGNVLFGIGSGIAIAAHYNLNLCVNQASPSFQIVREIAPLLNMVPKTCPKAIQKSLELGNKVNLYNHCCAFEDFYVTRGKYSKSESLASGKMMSLDKLFGWHQQQQEKLGNIFDLHGSRQSWKYLKIGSKSSGIM